MMQQNYQPDPRRCTCCGGRSQQLGEARSAAVSTPVDGGWCADCLSHLVCELRLRLRSEEAYADAVGFVLAVNKPEEAR